MDHSLSPLNGKAEERAGRRAGNVEAGDVVVPPVAGADELPLLVVPRDVASEVGAGRRESDQPRGGAGKEDLPPHLPTVTGDGVGDFADTPSRRVGLVDEGDEGGPSPRPLFRKERKGGAGGVEETEQNRNAADGAFEKALDGIRTCLSIKTPNWVKFTNFL